MRKNENDALRVPALEDLSTAETVKITGGGKGGGGDIGDWGRCMERNTPTSFYASPSVLDMVSDTMSCGGGGGGGHSLIDWVFSASLM